MLHLIKILFKKEDVGKARIGARQANSAAARDSAEGQLPQASCLPRHPLDFREYLESRDSAAERPTLRTLLGEGFLPHHYPLLLRSQHHPFLSLPDIWAVYVCTHTDCLARCHVRHS